MNTISLVAQSASSALVSTWPADYTLDRFGWLVAQATVIAAAALAILWLVWRLQPAARATLACTGLALMTFVPTATFLEDGWWSVGSLLSSKSASVANPQTPAEVIASTEDSHPPEPVNQSAWWAATQAAVTGAFTSEVAEPSEPNSVATEVPATSPVTFAARRTGVIWYRVVWVAWLSCMLLGFARLFVGLYAVRKIRRSSKTIHDESLESLLCEIESTAGITRAIHARENEQINSAAVIGWRHPTLLLPSDWRNWTKQELRVILSHEMAHIQRNDFLMTVLGQVALSINLYNPLAHLLFRQLRLSQELAADALAAKIAGGRRRYTQVLAAFALRQPSKTSNRLGVFPNAAQAFLPTRHTFVRRLEMLKNLPGVSTRAGASLSLATKLALALAAFFASGLRPSTLIAQEGSGAAEVTTASPAGTAPRALTSYVPDGVTCAVMHIDVQAVLASELGKAVLATGAMPQELDIFGPTTKLANVESALFVYMASGENTIEPMAILRLQTPLTDEQKSTQASFKVLDDRTFAYHSMDSVRDAIGQVQSAGQWAELLAEQGDASVKIAGIVSGALPDRLTRDMMRMGGPALVLLPMWEQVDSISMGLDLQDATTITTIMHTDSAEEVAATTQALITLGKNYVQVLPRAIGSKGDVAGQVMASTLSQKAVAVLDSAEVQAKPGSVNMQVTIPDSTNTLITYALPAIKAARIAASRAQSTNNLKLIALAMHNYESVYNHLPAAVIYDSASGTPRSWRVELLPFLDHAELYQRYKKDEPWDSAANLKVLEQMPQVYAAPGGPEGNETSYLAIVSENGGLTARADGTPPKFADFTDGLSNTVVFAETKKRVPWTKPVDATETATIPMEGSFRTSEYGTLAAFGDGSVRFIAKSIDAQLWASLLTRSGRENIDYSQPRNAAGR